MSEQILKGRPETNGERLMSRLYELGKIGRNSSGGMDRQLGSEADAEARKWIRELWHDKMGLDVAEDPIANLWGTIPGDVEGRPIILGSHHDSVPNGGIFDGPLGVLLATEVMETIRENNIHLKHPLQIISFTGEEPNSFGTSTLASKVMCGRMGREDIEKLSDRNTGRPLKDAIDDLGGDFEHIENARYPKDKAAAFIECHIEQGRRLIDKGESVAAVTCITGIYRERIIVEGEANHAGTTIPKHRRDGLCGASEVCLAVEKIMNEPDMTDLAATIGYVNVEPNASNIIPGRVTLLLDLRTCEPEKRKKALDRLKDAVAEIEARRNIRIVRELLIDQLEMPMSETVIDALLDAMEYEGQPRRSLVSMAGHDASNMARLTESAMLFVASIGGYSHCPQEDSRPEDIAKAAQVVLDAVLLLDERLS